MEHLLTAVAVIFIGAGIVAALWILVSSEYPLDILPGWVQGLLAAAVLAGGVSAVVLGISGLDTKLPASICAIVLGGMLLAVDGWLFLRHRRTSANSVSWQERGN